MRDFVDFSAQRHGGWDITDAQGAGKTTDHAKAKPAGELEDKPLPREQLEAYLFEMRQQPNWRKEADRCADYYDGNQLSRELVDILQSRGQPPLVANLIKPTIDTVLGLEAKSRTDWRVRPEDDGSCTDDMAKALSAKLKEAEIESRADRAVSDAYAAQCKSGIGWVEVSKEADALKYPFRVRYIHRREIYWDWRAEQPDLSDARYLIRRMWIGVDEAMAMMPQHAELLRQTASGWDSFDPMIESSTGLSQSFEVERDTRLSPSDWRDSDNNRVCLYEVWYRKWVSGYVMTLPNGVKREVDLKNPRHAAAIVSGAVSVEPAVFKKVRLAWFCGPHFLDDIPSPYRHCYFPYVPFFGYREDLTGVPYGLIRSMISPQDEINARKSKMMWILNSRRVITDADAVIDHAKAAEEVSRPDGYIILNAKRNPNSQFRVDQGAELASQQFQVMQEAKQEIAESSGIHKSMMGQASGATSGLAINSLVEQGLTTLAEINDNYAFSRRLVGEMLFEMVRESMVGRTVRVDVGDGKNRQSIILNEPVQDPETGQQIINNDVRKIRAKVVLDDVPSTPTYRMQQLQMISEIVKSLPPNLQAAVMDFVIEATDMPDRHKIADRIRTVAGIKDENQASQEAQAMAQQQAQQAEMQAKLTTLQAAELAAKIRKLNAEAEAALRPKA